MCIYVFAAIKSRVIAKMYFMIFFLYTVKNYHEIRDWRLDEWLFIKPVFVETIDFVIQANGW